MIPPADSLLKYNCPMLVSKGSGAKVSTDSAGIRGNCEVNITSVIDNYKEGTVL